MKKSTSNILLLGALGALGYFIFKSQSVNAMSGLFGGETFFGGGGGLPSANVSSDNEIRSTETQAERINALNKSASDGTLQRTSQTLARNVTIGNTTGNIARLGDGSTKFISVNQPARDSSGQTNFDRLIAKNTAGKTPAQLARKKSVRG